MELLLKLLLAHLIGDFVLQPGSWVNAKEQKKLRAWQFYIHVLVHGILTLLLVGDITFLGPAIIITVSHGLIDWTKLTFQRGSNRKGWFVVDQVLHLSVIGIVWTYVERPVIDIHFSSYSLLLITAIIFITTPASIAIKMLISQWTPTLGSTNTDSLLNAGKFIGILERLMVFTFALMNNWGAIGFLIAAKSVFRFGDLKEGHDIKLTEYVLIGTLLSFGTAIAASLVVNAQR
jgi:hypothetical protein